METIIIVGLGVLLVLILVLRFSARDNTIELKPDSKRKPQSGSMSISESVDPARLSDLQLENVVQELLRSGQKIEAIKILRAARGLGLKEAKEAIDQATAGHPFSVPQLALEEKSRRAAPPEANEDLVSLIRRGQKINAIKLLREQTGLGLKEAKEEVDRLEREIRRL